MAEAGRGTGLILLAGGASRRMGRDKASLELRGERMTHRILRRLHGIGEPVVVCNRTPAPAPKDVPTVPDRWPGRGPLAGIQAGLAHGQAEVCLVVACDMPFVSRSLASFLLAAARGQEADAVVPRAGGRDHPLFAVYRRRTLPLLEEILEQGADLSVTSFLGRIRTRLADETEWDSLADPTEALLNLNRPQEYARVRERLLEEHPDG